MSKKDFVHLHLHTEYSLLDGLPKIKQMLAYVSELGMKSVAVTDHGAMYGAVEFYKKAKDMGIKPIIGMEAYITKDLNNKDKSTSKNYHLLLLAKNEDGYKNLMKLTSLAHINGFYYKPRIDYQILKKYSSGLICTSACALGEVSSVLSNESFSKAKEITQKYLDIFGKDYYLELQIRNFDKFIQNAINDEVKSQLIDMRDFSNKVNPQIVKLSRSMGIPLVATNDVHYIKPEDAIAQDAAVCIATGKTVNDIKRLRYIDIPDLYIKSPEEMYKIFKEFPDAPENTLKISEQCELTISTLGKWFFPKLSLEKKATPEKYLEQIVMSRVKKKYNVINDEIKDRIKRELEIINQKGFAPYFLIMMDMVNWANSKGIITNTRGSAAGSIVSYIIGITTVDPLCYYLPFERFLNPFRPLPPDIDLDVADDRREELLNYIYTKYGKDKVAQICTFGRMLSRAAVRDIARVLGYQYSVGDKIAKLIPPPKQGFPITIPKALEEVAELKNIYDSDPDAKKILDLATQIEGNARHISVHAAGVVISPTDLVDFTPIQKEPSGEKIITQYEMHTCENVGLIKFDILGIRNLSILGAAIDLVEEVEGIKVDISNIPLDDKKTFKMLGEGDTMGTFQLGSSGMAKYLKELKPERVEDLMAMVALYRPGPIQVIPEYIRRKSNPKLVKYLDPRMEKFLSASYGLIVYQEDLLFCALEMAGYTWEEADKFRKAVGKKIPEEMAAQKEKFIEGIIKNGQTKVFAEDLWKLFEPFQAYGFNKAHAASYGIVAYQTSYMKANYPVCYMTALLTAESNDAEKVSLAINECRRMKIKVLAPDINQSNIGFTIVEDDKSLEGKAIRFGLGAIKNVGEAAIKSIMEARNKQKFSSMADFLSRVDFRKVNKKVLESLIKVGALSEFGKRSELLANLEETRSKLSRISKNENQQGLFNADTNESTVKINFSGLTTEIPEFTLDELASLEKQFLGFSLSSKPIEEILGIGDFTECNKISEILENESLNEVAIACIIKDIKIILTKKSGQEMAFAKVEDTSGIIELVIFPRIFSQHRQILLENKPLIVKGKRNSRDTDVSIIVESFDEIQNPSDNANLFIKIPQGTSRDKLFSLKKLLENRKGNKNVTLIFEQTKEKLDLPFKVDWDESLAKLINGILDSNGIS